MISNGSLSNNTKIKRNWCDRTSQNDDTEYMRSDITKIFEHKTIWPHRLVTYLRLYVTFSTCLRGLSAFTTCLRDVSTFTACYRHVLHYPHVYVTFLITNINVIHLITHLMHFINDLFTWRITLQTCLCDISTHPPCLRDVFTWPTYLRHISAFIPC